MRHSFYRLSFNLLLELRTKYKDQSTKIYALIHNLYVLARLQIAGFQDYFLTNIYSGNYLRKIIPTSASGYWLLDGFSVLNYQNLFNTGKGNDGIIRNGHCHLGVVSNDLRVRERTGS